MPARNGFSELAADLFTNSGDIEKQKKLLSTKYTENDLIDYLQHDDPLVSRAAAAALGLIADMSAVQALVESLKNRDLSTSYNAEIALWHIWSRSGDESVDELLNTGRIQIRSEDFLDAIDTLTKAIRTKPDFAEGYNQRAIAYFMLQEWDNSLKDCKKTIELNPQHFGAYAGMGHVYFRLRKIDAAIKAYRQALTINPNLIAIAQTIRQIHRGAEESEEE